MCDGKEAEFSLKVMINKEKNKVLFVEADSHFADILLSFLTLPLGRIIKVLNNHYGVEAPTIGSLSSLYHSLENLGIAHFWTEDAKQTLLNPRSSIEDDYEKLKLAIADFHPAEYFYCSYHSQSNRFRSVSVYYDNVNEYIYLGCANAMMKEEDEKVCQTASRNAVNAIMKEEDEKVCQAASGDAVNAMMKEEDEKVCQAASGDAVFTINIASFIISDDLHILPSEIGLLGIIIILGITDADKAEAINVTLGFSEVMSLLKLSLISQTPFSDLILSKTRQTNSVTVGSEPETSLHQIENEQNPQIENEQNPNSIKMILKVVIQKSTGKVLYAQAKDDFIEFLFSFLNIPLGGVEHLLAGRTCVKAINNLYWSTADLIDDKYFNTPDTKDRLTKPNVAHGCIPNNHMLPLTEECLPASYSGASWSSSTKFPNGQGSYLKGTRTYHVTDDLTVTPFCIISTLSSLNKQKILINDDVKEVKLQIGLKEGLSIVKASLTSTTALTDALLNHKLAKQTKPEL